MLILPSGGNYAGVLGEGGIERVKDWVAAGGTIVALGDAVNFLGNSKVDLLELLQENALRDGDEKKAADKAEKGPRACPGTAIASEADFDKVTRAATELPDSVPGAIARVRVRPDYWLTAGMGDTVYTMVEGRAIYAPVKADKGINAAYYDAADKLVVSGHLWAENKKQMAFKPLVVSGTSGRGVVVGFTQDPNFRAIGDGLNLLFLNAVFRGPAHCARRRRVGTLPPQAGHPCEHRGAFFHSASDRSRRSRLGRRGNSDDERGDVWMIRIPYREFDAPGGGGADRGGGPQPRDEGGRNAGGADAGVQRAPQERELHPAGDSRGRGQSRGAPMLVDAEPAREGNGA